MGTSAIDITCPGCGARVSIDQKVCRYCHQPVTVSSFESVYSMPIPTLNKYANTYKKELQEHPENADLNISAGMCFLKLKLFDKALQSFEAAMLDNFDNSEMYFYAAVCLLQGKKPFLHQRATIDKVMEYVNSAIMVEARGIYYYFLAYVKYDYFKRKFLKVTPDYSQTLAMAATAGYSDFDVDLLFSVTGTEKPNM